MREDRLERFAAYVEALAKVIGHADRAAPLRDYCLGLLLPGDRKSVEPIAAVTAPARVSAQHQSLLHFVANAPWSTSGSRPDTGADPADYRTSAARSKPGSSTTPAFRRKAVIRSGWRVRIAANSASRTTARLRSACRWPIMRRACRSPGGCICRWNGPAMPRAAPRPVSRDDRVSDQAGDRAGEAGRPMPPVCRAALF